MTMKKEKQINSDFEIIRTNMSMIKVCVPKSLSKKEIIKLTEVANPCNTKSGWSIKQTTPCVAHSNKVHVTLIS